MAGYSIAEIVSEPDREIPHACVVIPVRNNLQGLLVALTSLEGSPEVFDVIVVDDGSCPPLRASRDALDVVPSKRLILLSLPRNRGIAGALNAGFAYALERPYRFIGRLDSGDAARPNRWSEQFAYLEQHGDAAVVGSHVEFTDPHGVPLYIFKTGTTDAQIRARMLLENCLIHSAVTFRASAIRNIGLYDETCQLAEDYEYFLRLGRANRYGAIPRVLTTCEMNPAGLSVARRRQQQRKRLTLQLRCLAVTRWQWYAGLIRSAVALVLPFRMAMGLKGWSLAGPAKASATR